MQCGMLEGGRNILLRASSCLQFQAIRWRRKPWWLPTAKTKVFRIPVKTLKSRDEEAEMRRLINNYNTYKRSFWAFLKTRYETKEALSKTHAEETTEDAEIERIIALIEKDNARVRSIREEALKIEWKNMEQQIIETRTRFEEEEAAKLVETEKLLKLEMERLKNIIPLEGIDEAIEKALSTEIDYNFSIDKKGNKYYGRYTKPQAQLQEPQQQLSARSS